MSDVVLIGLEVKYVVYVPFSWKFVDVFNFKVLIAFFRWITLLIFDLFFISMTTFEFAVVWEWRLSKHQFELTWSNWIPWTRATLTIWIITTELEILNLLPEIWYFTAIWTHGSFFWPKKKILTDNYFWVVCSILTGTVAYLSTNGIKWTRGFPNETLRTFGFKVWHDIFTWRVENIWVWFTGILSLFWYHFHFIFLL